MGKPSGDYSIVVFDDTYMDNIIYLVGWGNWDNEFYKQNIVTYAKFQCSWPGAV